MSKYPIPSKNIQNAMHAHTNLNVFGTIRAILEGGVLYGGGNQAAKKIIDICNKECIRQLKLCDAAIDAQDGEAT